MKSLYKIFHTTCHTGWGGLEKRIFNESVWMDKNGHKIVIAAPEDTPLYNRSKSYGFKTYPVAFSRLSIHADYRKLTRIIENERPWVVNTHGNKDSKLALLAAHRREVPLRILSRHISAHVRNSWYNRFLYRKLCHYVFTTADYTTVHLRKQFKLNDMQVFSIPSGIIPPAELPDKDSARLALCEELHLDRDTRFIGFAGRVSADKGVTVLIDAFKCIHRKLPAHHLVIAGDGTPGYMEQLGQQIEQCGLQERIHLTGFKEDIYPYYRAFDCKVLPSINIGGIPFEGVPQSLLEAMYCECPVIGARTGGIMDIIEDGTTGLLFDPVDADQLGRRILSCLQDDIQTRKRTQCARERVGKKHTIDVMGRNIVRIYRLHQVRLDRPVYPSAVTAE